MGSEEPIKPWGGVTIYQGVYDENVLAFVGTPTKAAQPVLEECENLECAQHVVAGMHIIHRGDEVVIVKWPFRTTRRADGKTVYGFEAFCCVTCQRNRAVELKTARNRRR